MKNFSSNQFQPFVLSGLLLGLSVPSFSFLPLGFLAWAWLVPLLFELKKTDHFLPFLARVLVSVGIGFSIITLWVVNASLLGFFASAAMGIFVWTVPLVLFYFVRRFWNRTVALVSLPFVWTSWEWLYHQTEFSFGAVRLGYTQADMLWLIQYADTTGVEGVTFWLVLLNVALFVFVERQFGGGANNKFNRSAFFNRRAILPAALFALPLAYAAYVFLKPQPPAKEITVLAVQPNVSPFVEYSPKRMTEIFGKQLALTDRAVKTESPDLIVWHEVAVPYILSDDAAANGYLAKQVAKWNAPVLTGVIEVKDYAENEPRPPLLEAQNRSREFFNASALFAPAQIRDGRLPVDLSRLYLKRRLMPFLEQVPFSDSYPPLADLIIPIGIRPRLSRGEIAKTFDFQTKDGAAARVGAMICYENLYPEMSAELVEGGAQVLTAITNEGFFSGSQGQYQLAAFSRFRSIETRRAMIRAAATGKTWTTDKFGRTRAEVPMWSEQILRARVALSDERTIYVRWGNFFPIICASLVLLLIFSTIWQAFRRKTIYSQN